MTVAQRFRTCEILVRHFQSGEDAGVVVTAEVEDSIEADINDKKDTLATKADMGERRGELGALNPDVRASKADGVAKKADIGASLKGE